jgi:hypothetical protein
MVVPEEGAIYAKYGEAGHAARVGYPCQQPDAGTGEEGDGEWRSRMLDYWKKENRGRIVIPLSGKEEGLATVPVVMGGR